MSEIISKSEIFFLNLLSITKNNLIQKPLHQI